MLHGASDIIVALSDLMKPRSPKQEKCELFVCLYYYIVIVDFLLSNVLLD